MEEIRKIFVASSSNEREFAERVAGILEEIKGVEVVSWWENRVLSPGKSHCKRF